MTFEIGPYDPCPCGSGAKYKFCCAAKNKDKRHGKYPIGTVILYGPDDKTTTKIAASVILRDGGGPILQRWHGENVAHDENVQREIKQFFAKHGVKTVAAVGSNMGCPHEEGVDFPRGHECPFCPFWEGKQGIGQRDEWNRDFLGAEGIIARDFDDGDDMELDDDELDDDDDLDEDDDWENDDWEDDDSDGSGIDYDASMERIQAILGDEKRTFDGAIGALCDHLKANLQLPCEVTGSEDFSWEEPYVFGAWDPEEYEQLKKTQPSYEDRYELLDIDHGDFSEWMMFDEDIAAHVRRKSDGKEFILGLSELEATDENSPNAELLEDFSVFLVNSR